MDPCFISIGSVSEFNGTILSPSAVIILFVILFDAAIVYLKTIFSYQALPELDFLVVPLNENTVSEIWKELLEKDHLVHEGIIHVQIENNGNLVFGGYDNFHRECVIAYPGVSVKLLEELKASGVIRGYKQGNA